MKDRGGQDTGGAMMSEERIRRILDERTVQLAMRRTTAAEAMPKAPMLACRVAEEVYGIALDAVVEVMPGRPYAPVAGAPPAVLGAIGVAGRIFSIVDLGVALGLPGRPSTGVAAGHLLRLRRTQQRILLRVDRVLGVVPTMSLSPDRQPAPGMGGKATTSYATAPAGAIAEQEVLLGILDLGQLLDPLLPSSSASGA